MCVRSADGTIGPRTRWREYGAAVADEPAYIGVKRNRGGSSAHDIFEVRGEKILIDEGLLGSHFVHPSPK